MNNNSKMLLALGAGALIGYYLNSDKGRKVRKDAANNIQETAKQASVKMTEVAETAKTAINEVAGQAKTYVANLVRSADMSLGEVMEVIEKGKEAVSAKAKLAEKTLASNGS